MNQRQLESWSIRTVQALQDVCDEAQEAAGDPDGETECQDLRSLISEFDAIFAGRPLWQQQVRTGTPCEDLDGLLP